MVLRFLLQLVTAVILGLAFVVLLPAIITHLTPVIWGVAGTLWVAWAVIFAVKLNRSRSNA